MTDLVAFDNFAERISMKVLALGIGGFLPARQFEASGYAVTLFFTDDGDFDDASVTPVAKS